MTFLEQLTNYVITLIESLGIFGPILSCLIIVIESMIPILPLCVFISLNFIAFGNVLGLFISYGCTVVGCVISFTLCRYCFRGFFERRFRKNEKVNKLMVHMDNIKLRNLVLLHAIPFTPAFAINIAGGLSQIGFKKYLVSLFIGKIFMVFFWGYIGTSLIDCIKNPIKFVYIGIILVIAYLISMFVSKKFNIN